MQHQGQDAPNAIATGSAITSVRIVHEGQYTARIACGGSQDAVKLYEYDVRTEGLNFVEQVAHRGVALDIEVVHGKGKATRVVTASSTGHLCVYKYTGQALELVGSIAVHSNDNSLATPAHAVKLAAKPSARFGRPLVLSVGSDLRFAVVDVEAMSVVYTGPEIPKGRYVQRKFGALPVGAAWLSEDECAVLDARGGFHFFKGAARTRYVAPVAATQMSCLAVHPVNRNALVAGGSDNTLQALDLLDPASSVISLDLPVVGCDNSPAEVLSTTFHPQYPSKVFIGTSHGGVLAVDLKHRTTNEIAMHNDSAMAESWSTLTHNEAPDSDMPTRLSVVHSVYQTSGPVIANSGAAALDCCSSLPLVAVGFQHGELCVQIVN
ncbi:hypothetical protein RI367_005631 [Sorochytrium milnesiophthora]